MSNPISRRHFMGGAAAVGVAAGSAVIPHVANAALPPDDENIKKTGRGWEVRPNGIDDHDNLEWALCNTAPGGTVKLTRGTFKIGSVIVVPNFDGKLIGAGVKKTTMTCTDELNFELWEANGKAGPKPSLFPRHSINGTTNKTAPGLIMFYKTPLQTGEDPIDRANRIEIRDLRCRGAMIGEDWMFGDEVLCLSIINSIDWQNTETEQLTTRQDVLISRVDVDGYATPEFGAFGNACACISVLGSLILTDNYNLTGITDGDALGLSNGGLLGIVPAEGDVTIRDCKLSNCRLGPAIVGYKNGNLLFDNMSTDGCKADCVRLLDNSNCKMEVRNCDLFCDSFILPPELAIGGAPNQPSSLGCVLAIQGVSAALGFPNNIQWLTLAPANGGAWRPLGPAFVPQPSTLMITDNSCRSSTTPNTYCFHIADLSHAIFGMPSIDPTIKDNDCEDSETCVSLEFVSGGLVKNNDCSSQAYGVELHASPAAEITGNSFDFPSGVEGCEIRMLAPGDKVGLSHVVPSAGTCGVQG